MVSREWSVKTERGAIVSDLRSSQQYRSTSLIAARLSDDFIAPLLFTGACNTERFNEWLETHLCAYLDQTHVVILDNARFHKSNRTQELINGCGASLLFLPPYSPDLNSIEKDLPTSKDDGNTMPKNQFRKSLTRINNYVLYYISDIKRKLICTKNIGLFKKVSYTSLSVVGREYDPPRLRRSLPNRIVSGTTRWLDNVPSMNTHVFLDLSERRFSV